MTEGFPKLPKAHLKEGVLDLLPASQLASSDDEEPPDLLPDMSDTEEGSEEGSDWSESDGDHDDDLDRHRPHLEPYYLYMDDETWEYEGSTSSITEYTQGTLSSPCSHCDNECQCVTSVSSDEESYMSSDKEVFTQITSNKKLLESVDHDSDKFFASSSPSAIEGAAQDVGTTAGRRVPPQNGGKD